MTKSTDLVRLTPMDVGSMKTAFLSLGDILVDGNITFLRDDAMPQPNKKVVKTNNSSSSSRTSAGKTYKAASASEESDSSDDESPKKSSKSKQKEKKTYKATENDSDDNSNDDADNDDNDDNDDSDDTESDDEKSHQKSYGKKGKKLQRNTSDSDDESETPNVAKKKSNGGMVRLHEINSQRSVMVFVRLPACEFHEFYCAQKVKVISLNFQTLNRFLKRIDKDDDVMTWILRSDKPDHLIIQNRSNSNGGKFSEYEIPLIEVTKQKLDYDEATFESMVSMPSAQLQSLCKSIKDFSEYIEIKSIGKQAQFYCKGESGTIRETLGQAPKEGNGKQAVVQGIFEARYIAAASKCTPLSPKVDIFLKNDWPVVLTYTFSRKSKICFWISPVAVKPHESNNDISGDQEDLSDLSDDENDSSSKKIAEVSKKRANHPRVSRS